MDYLVHCSKCRSFPCNCWQNQWGPDPGEAFREGFSRGFEAAKSAAKMAIDEEVENGTRHGSLNTLTRLHAVISQLQPEAHNG